MSAIFPPRLRLCLVAATLFAVLFGCTTDEAVAPPARIAVAANFAVTAEALREAHHATGGAPIDLVIGSTGSLHAQITAGAPFDAFLAADTDRPDRLIAADIATDKSRFIYAIGRLVLWTAAANLHGDPADVLRRRKYDHLAVADPVTAPYGAAARAFLDQADLEETVAPRLVIGQSVGQAYQFAAGGNADLGLVALSQIGDRGSAIIIPDDTYPPLTQAAVALTEHPAALAFLHFVRHDSTAHAIIADHGYHLPAETSIDAERR